MAGRMNSIAILNNKGGVGTTSLVYHLAWMYANLDYNVLVADLDPQADLTTMFLSDDELEALWEEENGTIRASLQSLLAGTGDAAMPRIVEPTVGLSLVAGDLRLSNAEDELSSQWPACLDGKERAFRFLSAIWRSLRLAADHVRADLVLLDVGPNLGALNRAVLLTADYVVVPVAPDLYALQGLCNLGPTLCRWRHEWAERRKRNPAEDLPMPHGAMKPIGYVLLQHAVRFDRPMTAYGQWMARIPDVYRHHVLDQRVVANNSPEDDEHCLATLKRFPSLQHLAQEARKPMFALKPADGALDGHIRAIEGCRRDFRDLARKIAGRCEVPEPSI